MGKNKENLQHAKAIVAEFSVSMHCNACERTVVKAINKIKGVEKFATDMKNQKVVVTGKFEPQKVLKKLKKKTGKKVEILVKENKGEKGTKLQVEEIVKEDWRFREAEEEFIMSGFCDELLLTTIFSDENPNACNVM